jgi:hypothetical protein
LRTEGLAWGLTEVSSRGSRGTGRVAGGGATGFSGGGRCAGAVDGAAAGAAGPADAASARIGEPLDTLSPTLMLSSLTTPAAGEGISIVALSDSSVTSDCSFSTESPGLTRTSMTSTSLKSPMSGTETV